MYTGIYMCPKILCESQLPLNYGSFLCTSAWFGATDKANFELDFLTNS